MLFGKKADEEKMKAFWAWFAQNEEWIIQTINQDGMAVVDAIDAQLSPAFAVYRIEIEFQLGFNDGAGEFFFFDLGKSALHKDAVRLGELMPQTLRERWKFIIER